MSYEILPFPSIENHFTLFVKDKGFCVYNLNVDGTCYSKEFSSTLSALRNIDKIAFNSLSDWTNISPRFEKRLEVLLNAVDEVLAVAITQDMKRKAKVDADTPITFVA